MASFLVEQKISDRVDPWISRARERERIFVLIAVGQIVFKVKGFGELALKRFVASR